MAIGLAINGRASISAVSSTAGRSLGETHGAIERLRRSGLVDPVSALPYPEALMGFLEWGVPFAFPAIVRAPGPGMATALIDPAVGPAVGDAAYVWATGDGAAIGDTIVPLHPRVPEAAARNPKIWQALSLIDLVRVGGALARADAVPRLRDLLFPRAGQG